MNKVKRGDEFIWIELPELGIGKVIKLWKTKEGQSFDLEFENGDERGQFYTNEIGVLIRRPTKLEKALK